MRCCKYNPIDFRHRIVIQNLTLTANDSGGQSESWTTFATVWAIITPKIVKEVNFAQRIEPRIDHEIVIRYLANLTTKMRIVFGARTFEIKAAIIEDEVQEFIKIMASERTGT
jgi:SPP1 family predicted phage head-tail adaptor